MSSLCTAQVTRADVYVALRYGGWQEAVLRSLAAHFDANSKAFPAAALQDVLQAVKDSGTAGDMADKALKQTVIPFAKLKMSEAQSGGAQVGLHVLALPFGTSWVPLPALQALLQLHAKTWASPSDESYRLTWHCFPALTLLMRPPSPWNFPTKPSGA